MEIKVMRKTVEESTVEGIVERVTKSVDITLEKEGVQVGTINLSEWGGSFNVHNEALDVEELMNKIIVILTEESL